MMELDDRLLVGVRGSGIDHSVAERRQPSLDHVLLGIEAADRHVGRVIDDRRHRDQADQLRLDRAGAERGRQPPHLLDHRAERRRQRVVDVGRDLGPPAGEHQPDRPHPARPAARLAQLRRHRPRRVQIGALELNVEGGERRPRGDQRRAPVRVRHRRAEVGSQLAPLHPQPQLRQAAVAEVGALGAAGLAGQRAVEEDRHADPADLVGDGDRLGAGHLAILLAQPDDRADVERPDRRVHPYIRGHVDRLERLLGAGHERLGQSARLARQGEDRAAVVGVSVDVEDLGAPPERRAELVEDGLVAGRRDVGDGEQDRHRGAQISSSPPPRIASPSISTVGSLTTTSRWTGTCTVPPIPAEAPKATCAVPKIFSSSRMFPVRIASSLVPIPSSATLVPSGPCGVSSSISLAPSSPVAPIRWPPSTVSRTGDSTSPTAAIEPSTTRVPSAVPSTGAMNPSPQGRLPKAPLAESSPASTIPSRPSIEKLRSLPLRQVIRTCEPWFSALTIAQPRRRISSRSPFISRASISSVTPGRVAIRTPASLAALRAAVWDSDWIVGARTTSAAAIAAATGRGGSAAWVSRSEITARVASAPSPCASIRIKAPISSVTGLQITITSSPAATPMHWRTTVRTALSRSAPGIGPD